MGFSVAFFHFSYGSCMGFSITLFIEKQYFFVERSTLEGISGLSFVHQRLGRGS